MKNSLMLNKLENGLIALGAAFGVTQIQTILGIIILSLQVGLMLYKIGLKVYEKIKDKKYDEVPEIVDEGLNKLEEFKNNLDKESE